ncbi:MAG TPA: hypothetical protein VMW01_00140 [Williamwhitmania sp.]|nr:hypothetical protein [Williamwhitmania sp.]
MISKYDLLGSGLPSLSSLRSVGYADLSSHLTELESSAHLSPL